MPPESKSATYWVEKGDKVRIYGRDNKNVPQVPEEYKCRYAIVKGFSKENDQDVIVQFDDGKVANFVYSSMSRNPGTWEMDFFYPCDDNLNEMTMGERGMQDAQDGNPPSKIGGGLEDYMSAYNAVMQKMGKEPLPIVQPDQAYLDALSRGNLEEMGPATGHVEGTDAAGVIRQIAADLNEVSGVMNNASSTTTASEFAGFIQAKAAELLEAADELGIDGPAPALQENEKKSFKVGEFVYIVSGGLRGATGKIAEPTTLVTGEEGYVIHLYSDADSKVFGKQGDEVIAGASRIKSGGTFDGSELYDIDETAQWGGFTGGAAPLDEPVRDSGQVPLDQLKKLFSIFTEMGLSPDAILQKPEFAEAGITNPAQLDERSEDDDGELEPAVKYGSGATLRFNRRTGEFYDVERDIYLDDKEAYALIKETVRKTLSSKKKVKSVKENSPLPSATRVKYSSDPEMNQVMRIAAEMLEMPSRSRGTITLKSVQSALEAHSIDSVIENDMIIVDNKYVIAKKELLPKTAQKISFTVYAVDYLSNLQGEQQDLPMEEQERPDFVTSYSSDPHLDQIEDYALTVIEKGGNLRQLEDVLNRDAFATFLNGDVLTVDDEFFVGNEENFDISPDEDVRRLTGSNLVVGRIK